MKKSSVNPFRFLFIVFFFTATSIIISACSKYDEEVAPTSTGKTPAMKNDAYAKLSQTNLGSLDCSTLNENALNTKYRNKAIAKYGAATGPWYDGLVAAYKSNPNAYSVNPTYSKIYNYKSQITSAIQKGAKDLALSYCTDNTPGCNAQIFWSSYLKDAIDVYLNPIKTAKVIRKIINIAATIITEVVEKAVYGALTGLILGAPIAGIGTLPAAAFGAVVGGFLGLVAGVDRCVKGGYVCLVSCI